MKKFLLSGVIALFGFSAVQDASAVAARRYQAQQVQNRTKAEQAEKDEIQASVFEKLTLKQIEQIKKVNETDISLLLADINTDTQITKIYKGIASSSKNLKSTFGDNGKLAFNWSKGKAFVKAIHENRNVTYTIPNFDEMLNLIQTEESKIKSTAKVQIGTTRKKFLDPDMQGVLRYEYAKAGASAKALIANFYLQVYGVEIR